MGGSPHRDSFPERLTQLRESWPQRVSWRDVRDEHPHVFRQAASGVGVIVLAALCTLLWTALSFDKPGPLTLPGWIDWSYPFLVLISVLASIFLWMTGLILLSMPADARRGMAYQRFAAREGLGYLRVGQSPERLGVFFAEKLPGLRDPARKRRPVGAAPEPSLFLSNYSLWRGGTPFDADIQLGLASYSGGKDDPKGPRNGFRYLTLRLPRALPHLMIDARGNGSLRSLLPGVQKLSLEGDFDRYFTVYVPLGYERDALELLTPDVMACLIDNGRSWDIEVIDDRLMLASSRVWRRFDCSEVTAQLFFADLVGEELRHQAATYSDPRSARPRTQIAAQGRRLRRRSTAWTTAAFVGVIGGMLAFPHVLGWFLDR